MKNTSHFLKKATFKDKELQKVAKVLLSTVYTVPYRYGYLLCGQTLIHYGKYLVPLSKVLTRPQHQQNTNNFGHSNTRSLDIILG